MCMNKPFEPLESECTLVGDMSKWEREKWNIIERRKGSTYFAYIDTNRKRKKKFKLNLIV